MCVGSEFQVDGAETVNARDVKLLVMPVGLARRFVLEERKALGGRYSGLSYRILSYQRSAIAGLADRGVAEAENFLSPTYHIWGGLPFRGRIRTPSTQSNRPMR